MLTAYDFQTARILEDAGIDIILVGDSLANVLLGYDNTLPVTMEEMLHHTRAVSRGAGRLPVIADMPFLSYQVSVEEALRNAGRFVKEAGATGVKLEGGSPFRVKTIRRIIDAGIPVMGHLGLTPQSVHSLGGFKTQAKTAVAAVDLIKQARELEKAGVFSIVLENIPTEVAEEATRTLKTPNIGIGAGPSCDGQVLVINDILGFSGDYVPPFVRQYADLQSVISEAVKDFASDVRKAAFPSDTETTKMAEENLEDFAALLGSNKMEKP